MRAAWAMVLAACVTSNPPRVTTNPDPEPILCDDDLECPAGMRCDHDDSFEMVCDTPMLSAASRQRNAAPLRCVPGAIDAGTAATILCDVETPCPPGMNCVIEHSFAHAGDPLDGVYHCEPNTPWPPADLGAGWDAGTVRWLDEPFDAGTMLCGADGSCPPGMACVVVDEAFNSPRSGVPQCWRKTGLSASRFRTGPWDAGVLRWLDEPFDAGVP